MRTKSIRTKSMRGWAYHPILRFGRIKTSKPWGNNFPTEYILIQSPQSQLINVSELQVICWSADFQPLKLANVPSARRREEGKKEKKRKIAGTMSFFESKWCYCLWEVETNRLPLFRLCYSVTDWLIGLLPEQETYPTDLLNILFPCVKRKP